MIFPQHYYWESYHWWVGWCEYTLRFSPNALFSHYSKPRPAAEHITYILRSRFGEFASGGLVAIDTFLHFLLPIYTVLPTAYSAH